MNENTINERKTIDIGTGVQVSKKLQYNSHAPQDNKEPSHVLDDVISGSTIFDDPIQDGRTRNVQNLTSYRRPPPPMSHRDLRKGAIDVLQTSALPMSHHDVTRTLTRFIDIRPLPITYHNPEMGHRRLIDTCLFHESPQH